jgi:hypothetical protein
MRNGGHEFKQASLPIIDTKHSKNYHYTRHIAPPQSVLADAHPINPILGNFSQRPMAGASRRYKGDLSDLHEIIDQTQ